jgi:hypothetical protein
MNNQLAKEAALWKNWSPYSRPSSPEARRRHSNALSALTVGRPPRLLRSRSTPQSGKLPTPATLVSRRHSSAACEQGDEHLPRVAAIAEHRTFEDRMRDWEKAEQTLTSAFFLIWAMGVTLLGGWHVATQF